MRTLTLSICSWLLAGCGNPTTPMDMGGHDLPAPPRDLTAEPADLTMLPTATQAVVTTADFTGGTGTLGTIALATGHAVTKAIDTTLVADNGVRVQGGKVLVLGRDPAQGTVRVYDPANMFKSPVEIKTGMGSNPHDVVLLPGKSTGYVTLYNNKSAQAIGVIDLASPSAGVGKYVSLPAAAADPGDTPDASDLWLCGQYAYATLQDLDDMTFAPTGPGRIAVIDTTNDTVVGTIQLAGPNPNGFARDGAGCDLILTADAGNQFGAVDGKGGIERVDLAMKKSLGMAITDTALGGHPSGVATSSKTLAFAPLTVNNGMAVRAVAFDPAAGTLGATVVPDAGYLSFVAVSPDGQLFVGVATPGMGGMPAAGVYVGPADGTALPATAIDLGQAPNAIAFY